MKITFLGVSSALSDGYNSNILIEDNKTVMLFDCGEDIKHSLKAVGRKVEEIDSVYISHLHSDHSYGLSWLGYHSFFVMERKLKLFIHESMVSDIWSMLRPSMEKINGKDRLMTLTDYFDVKVFKNEFKYLHIGDFAIQPFRQDHVITPFGNMYSYGMKVYGKRDNKPNGSFFISSDTCKLNLPGNISEYVYDYIFSDCDVMNLNGVHPNYNDLKKLDKEVKKRMWLYHYTDLSKYDGKYGEMPDAVADGFAGFVKQGQVFEF